MPFYGRKPCSISAYYDVTNAPHAATVRASYVCPSDRYALVEVIQVEVIRMTAAAPAGLASSFVRFWPRSQQLEHQIVAAHLNTNVVGDRSGAHRIGPFFMFPDDRFQLVTNDFSVGGTVREFASFKLTEFDDHIKPDVQEPTRAGWWY